jgi:glucan phosphoethanolaminetransferase (alkaline phosphatase superfamily)
MNAGGRVREMALRGSVAALLVLGLAALDRFEVVRIAAFQLGRNDTQRPLLNAAVYVATYLAGAFAIAVLLLHRPLVRGFAAVLALALACVHVGFAAVNATGFTHHEAALFFTDAAAFTTDALRFFLPRFALPVLATVAISSAALWVAAHWGPRLRSWLWLLVPVAAFAAHQDLIARTSGKVYQFAAPIRVPLLTVWAWQHRLPHYAEREAPQIAPSEPPLADHIVLIVDESVNGHSLGINGGPPDTTPWLGSRPEGVWNYGIASAISNLSSSSNLLLQTGLPISAFPDRDLRSLRVANVFAYLAAAGYHTAFINAQTYSDQPPNLMTGFDLERIDTVSRLREEHRGLPESEFDRRALPVMRALVAEHPRSFTYLLKTGAHLPYADKAPEDQQHFQPALAAWEVSGDAVRTRNSYSNVLLWTVDHFLAELSRELAATGREVLVIYTSDHGQWLPGDPDAGRLLTPHATPVDPPMQQASVPLLLLAFGPRTRAAVGQRFDPRLVDRVSDFAIFPTVLQAAGYAATDTRRLFPPSLFDPDAAREPRAFLSGNIFAREGEYYVLTNQWNPDLGSACFVNPFSLEALRAKQVR